MTATGVGSKTAKQKELKEEGMRGDSILRRGGGVILSCIHTCIRTYVHIRVHTYEYDYDYDYDYDYLYDYDYDYSYWY